jgi:hypothetical protein
MPGFALSRRQRGFEIPLGIQDQIASDRPNAPRSCGRHQVQHELRRDRGAGPRHTPTTSSPARPLCAVSGFVTSFAEAKRIATSALESLPSCPIPEIARLGRTLRVWRDQFMAYFTTERANNGGTEAINGIIELHRRIARGSATPQLPTTDDLGRRGTHPPESPMSR